MTYKFHDSKGALTRFVGVEIELSNFNPDLQDELDRVVIEKWGGVVKDDGSIDGENPMELNTAPARGVKFIEQINDICSVLAKGKAKANRTCGLHVHVDARDFDPTDLLKTAILWRKIEPFMFKRVAKYRERNDFCAPWSKADRNRYGSLPNYEREVKTEGVTKTFLKMYENDMRGGHRYRSLNLTAFNEMGTLENRMHQGTVKASKIIKWAHLNSKIMEFVKKKSLDEIASIDTLNTIVHTKLL